ncbi:P-loop containing nucleoside triphosphate hydrolase protein, partial [Mycena albidolilacea]
PSCPKIFHGRGVELRDLISILVADSARTAILGPGGMGKTTLAMAALHHPTIIEKYTLRHFISCESANTCADLVTSIGLHLGLELSRQLSKAILQHFGKCGSCLVVLDNFETPWEPLESRGQVEDFIAFLADIPSLALLVTMRGAERPGKVKWSRPFLPPLEPLPTSASRQIFLAVADEPNAAEELALDDLLNLSGSLPLAVSLMANIASFEGYLGTLSRWQIENTSLLSDGHDKRSNLEKSIALSLGSPRISASPDAKSLLALLSLLPDGMRAEDIMASKVPIPDIRQSQTVLVRTSLAYIDAKGRLKALSPIREYIRRVHPPSPSVSRPLRTYFQDLLKLWQST